VGSGVGERGNVGAWGRGGVIEGSPVFFSDEETKVVLFLLIAFSNGSGGAFGHW
jgi:hypothetical protein